jgi:hypothetical protein
LTHFVAGGAALALAGAGFIASALTSNAAAEQEVTVKAQAYLSIYPVAGTLTNGQVTLRIKAFGPSNWNDLAGATVLVTTDGFSQTVVTDANGTAELRVPWSPSKSVTARLTDSPDGSHNSPSGPIEATAEYGQFGQPQADVVFVVDESGSTMQYHTAIQDNLNTIANTLAKSVDHRLGLVGFGTSSVASQAPYTVTPATASLADFSAAVATLHDDGYLEWGTDAIAHALQPSMGLRPEAGRCLVLIGDEKTQTNNVSVEQAAKALKDNDATLFSVVEPAVDVADYQQLALDSNGAWFDIGDFAKDPQPVLDALLNGCVSVVVQRPDLAVTIDDGQDEAPVGQTATTQIRVSNNGLAQANGVEVEAQLTGPVDLGPISSGGTATAQPGDVTRITWPTTSLAPGADLTYTVEWSPKPEAAVGTVIQATASVHDDGAQRDLSPADNEASDTTTVTAASGPEPTPEPGVAQVRVVYLDTETGGAPELSVTPLDPATCSVLKGEPSALVGFTEQQALACLPDGYVIDAIQNVESFAADTNQTPVITVRLTHHHTYASVQAERFIEFIGAGDQTPAPITQSMIWQLDYDEATGKTLGTSEAGFEEVAIPRIDPYWTWEAVVPAAGGPGPEDISWWPLTTPGAQDTYVTVEYFTGEPSCDEGSPGVCPPLGWYPLDPDPAAGISPPEPQDPPAAQGASAPGSGSAAPSGAGLPLTGAPELTLLAGTGILAIGTGLVLHRVSRRRTASPS